MKKKLALGGAFGGKQIIAVLGEYGWSNLRFYNLLFSGASNLPRKAIFLSLLNV